jgi:signal transduction histidine kinase
VTAIDGDVAAFAVRAIPKRPSTGPLGVSFLLAAMAAITLVLVVVSVDAMLAVRRGTGDLERALEVLESDLRAEVVPPRAKELAAIARRLRSMAERLADARDRERALERRVAHEARLGALGRLVAGVAHEIRNPLTGVHLLLDGIRRHSADARVQGDVDTALGEIARLDHVVGSLLGVARDARTEPAPLDVGEVVDERLRTMKELAAARGLTLDRRGDARATAERDVLVRVVDNLVRNAIEASPSGAAVVVEVGVTGGLVVVDVVDRGEGVPGDRVSQLFEPFFTLKPDGTGLGLWLSRALAEARGWALLYLREDGATRFSLRLPEVP